MPATLTSGTWLASRKLWKIQIGSVLTPPGQEDRDDDLVERQRERQQAAGDQGRPKGRERHVAERLEGVGSKVGRRLFEETRGPAQPGDRVVVDEHDAERRVADDDREDPERDVERGERRRERHARHDPGQGDGQDDDERDRLATEERIARDRERSQRAEDHRDRRRAQRAHDRRQERLLETRVVQRLADPFQREAGRWPGRGPALVERVDDHQREGDVDEGEDEPGRHAQRDPTDPRRSASEGLERAKTARNEQVDEHDRERDQRVGGGQRQVLGDVDHDDVADELRSSRRGPGRCSRRASART